MHKNFTNDRNMFNQVGLIKISFSGTYLGDYEMTLLKNQQLTKSFVPGVNHKAQPEVAQTHDIDPFSQPRNLKVESIGEE